ncbi:MAG: carbohydrate kinase [Lachnospiraceae bacterium]|jgi:xylulokinase|nr:carbohydrate kinase [Lachnospiraceae bacterium]
MSDEEKYVIGMDIGTTNIKAIIVSGDGNVVAEESRPNKSFTLKGTNVEQDAVLWWDISKDIFNSLIKSVGSSIANNIKGISISSHTVSMLPVDENGNPLRNAIIHQDNRSVEELEYIVDKIGFDRFVNIVGGQPAVAFLPNKILWYKKNEPDLFKKTKSFLQASSYINFKLTGVMSSDIDQATRTQCLDITTMNWSKEIGDVIGVDFDSMLPKLSLVDEIIGYVTEEAGEETGLMPGIPVIAGCSDAYASMHATGMSTLGEVGEASGTSSILFVGSDKKSAPNVPVVTRPCTIEGIPWIFDAPIQTSGAAIKWYIDKFACEEKEFANKNNLNIYDYLNELILASNPGSGGLLFFPYLLGEKAPLWNDYAKGMFIGLNMNTKRSDLARSVFEGTAYAIRHVIETVRKSGAKATALRVCGGGAKSKTWNKIKASVLNMPVLVLDEDSGDVPVGDALIVGHKVGVFPDLTEATKKIVKVKEVVEPDKEWVKVYDEIYPFFIKMYNHLEGDLKEIKGIIK